MKKLNLFFCMIFLLLNETVCQYRGFTDNFEDGSMELARRGRNQNLPPFIIWKTLSPATYKLTETGGVLRIDYSRTAGTGAYDCFTLTPPFPVNVNRNPHIQVKIKSSVSTALTIRPTYSLKPPTYEEISLEIPGDNQWHTYTLRLYDYLYKQFSVQLVDFYFGQGSGTASGGVIELDDVRIGWYLVEVNDFAADISKGNTARLLWKTNDPANTGRYRIYRDTIPDFKPVEGNFLGESVSPEYTDRNLETYMLYFYKVIPVGNSGEEFLPSPGFRVETAAPGEVPEISVIKTNGSTIKKYEKFETALRLRNVGIHNPYDPEDIDVYAYFFSPLGDSVRINGFYDNYRNAGQWKLRFATGKTGKWRYQVFVKDAGGTGKTDALNFDVVDSEHHGWIRPSKNNPHYFVHDDGTSYYAVGVYSPWRNNAERFKKFADHKANLFAIWDIGYGGFVNETGIIEEELGKYNQEKLGRIDSMLSILETSNIQLMYAIWPHDLFSETVWAAEWDKNPYREICDVVDVYSDELAWEYQKKKYRYMIARFAHSRSWGIWELINEMNGTDGWKEGRHQDAYAWVEKCDKFFEENDPYNHPVTASFSGGYEEYREPLYERNDVPNIHFYPAQGWRLKYPEDTLRSSLYNYVFASRRFWDSYDKPAIFGEAGADLHYFNTRSPKYREDYHNGLWATLSNGLAGTPVWWDYTILTDTDWMQLKYFSDFVRDIDVANLDFKYADITATGIDAYAMMSANSGFGWARSYIKNDISRNTLNINCSDGNYNVKWYDAWKGEYLKTDKVSAVNGKLTLAVPKLSAARKDIAFKIDRISD